MDDERMRAMREWWESIEPAESAVAIPAELLPYARLNERGEFAGFDRDDGVVDAYIAARVRELTTVVVGGPRRYDVMTLPTKEVPDGR